MIACLSFHFLSSFRALAKKKILFIFGALILSLAIHWKSSSFCNRIERCESGQLFVCSYTVWIVLIKSVQKSWIDRIFSIGRNTPDPEEKISPQPTTRQEMSVGVFADVQHVLLPIKLAVFFEFFLSSFTVQQKLVDCIRDSTQRQGRQSVLTTS